MKIFIDNTEVEVAQGERLIDVCDRTTTPVPRFCYHKDLSIAANCRMCLVEIEGSPKLQPSCTMIVNDGMKIHTKSKKVKEAQYSVMELLLINHPLDCPICDQGGECELQDVAINYGSNKTFFHEAKRVVTDEDIGDFIQTDLTRCIHCMRCVRFGTEVAGITELGATGRGEHIKISTFLESTIDSEVSGNMIDICPVGALTSKPYRYSIRSWQMTNHEGVARHDSLGSNLNIQTYNNNVYRVTSKANNNINGSWISDRDRFSYLSLQHNSRLFHPKIKVAGEYKESSWEVALDYATKGIKNNVIINNKGYSLALLADSTSTFEELYLSKKLATALGGQHIESIFGKTGNYSYLSSTATTRNICNFKHIIILGDSLEVDEPIIVTIVKKALDKGVRVSMISSSEIKPIYVNESISINDSDYINYINALQQLDANPDESVIICTEAIHNCKDIVSLNTHLSEYYPNILNVSIRGNIGSILATEFSSNNLINELDTIDAYILYNISVDNLSSELKKSIKNAAFTVSLDVFSGNEEYANVILPIAGLYEGAGTFINVNDDVQYFDAAITPPGNAKEGWKVLKVLADSLELDGFDITSHTDFSAKINSLQLNKDKDTSVYFESKNSQSTEKITAIKQNDNYIRHTDILMKRMKEKGYYVQ